mgnify:CR=1 FL=1
MPNDADVFDNIAVTSNDIDVIIVDLVIINGTSNVVKLFELPDVIATVANVGAPLTDNTDHLLFIGR